MTNMRYWDELKTVPPERLKPILAGRLKGKSDINPQWRMEAMTRMFGPVGIGWRYEIAKLWIQDGAPPEICAFALVNVWYLREADKWSEAIPGIGGSMLVEQESRGPHTSDEAYKMAVTDALGVAMKSIGIAADVYMGLCDGNKYIKPPERHPPSSDGNGEQQTTTNYKYLKYMGEMKKKVSPGDYYATMKSFGVEHANEILNKERQKEAYRKLLEISNLDVDLGKKQEPPSDPNNCPKTGQPIDVRECAGCPDKAMC